MEEGRGGRGAGMQTYRTFESMSPFQSPDTWVDVEAPHDVGGNERRGDCVMSGDLKRRRRKRLLGCLFLWTPLQLQLFGGNRQEPGICPSATPVNHPDHVIETPAFHCPAHPSLPPPRRTTENDDQDISVCVRKALRKVFMARR